MLWFAFPSMAAVRSCGLGQEEQNNSKLEKALGDDDGTPSAIAKKQSHSTSQYMFRIQVQRPDRVNIEGSGLITSL